jgi:hypothetical protein
MSEFRGGVRMESSCLVRPLYRYHVSSPFLAGVELILHRHSLLVLSSCLMVPAR